MRNQWINFYTGYVEVRAQGSTVEQFVNALVRNKVPIWDMKRESETSILFSVSLRHVSTIRRVLRRYRCKVYFKKRGGAPFLAKRLLFNSGFLLGFFLFLMCLFLLS